MPGAKGEDPVNTVPKPQTTAPQYLHRQDPLRAARGFNICDIQIRRRGVGTSGTRADRMIDLAHPEPEWINLAEGFVVQAAPPPGPWLVEAELDLPSGRHYR